MAVNYLHGVETVELATGSGLVSTVKSNVIGLVGTAPNADPNLFPLNTPVAVFADTLMASNLKTDGTLLDAVDAIYGQGSATVVVVRVAEGNNDAATWSAAVGSPSAKTGIWALLKSRPMLQVVPKLLCAPGLTSGRPSNGVATISLGNPGSGYTSGATTVTISAPPSGGIQATAYPMITGGLITAIVMTNGGAGYTSTPTVTISGTGTGATATASLGSVANPVGQTFAAIVDRLRAVAFVDGPGTSSVDAVNYRNDFGSERIMVLDPGVLAYDTTNSVYVNKPAAAYAAGMQARIDNQNGFWYPVSNQLIQNIGGPARPVDWMPNDPESEANYLNANQVTTVIHDDGFRFWGLRGTGTDPLWAQMSVRHTADMIYESLELAERKRLDIPFSRALLRNIETDVQNYLDVMTVRGALIGGTCKIDPVKNPASAFAAGQLTVGFDLEPAACLEHPIFAASRNPDYYNAFVETITGQLR